MARTRRLLCVAVLGVLGSVVFAAGPAFAGTFDVAAHTSLDRTYTWSITKVAHNAHLELTADGTYQETYDVTVTNTGSVDSNWKVSDGIHYAPGGSFTPTGVSASVTQGATTTNATTSDPTDDPSRCSTIFNTSVTDLYCAYSANLPSGDAGSVTANVYLAGGGTATQVTPFDFTNPDFVNEINKCVLATDSMVGALGTVCAGQHSVTFTYTVTIGPFGHCGDFEVDNTASLNDSAVHPSSAMAAVYVHVPCAGGCTLTIGFWKNHAGFGPQADVVTPLLPQWLGTSGGAKSQDVTTAALAVQFLSFNGSNNVFAASNGINKLYAQLLAAKLNIAKGANGSAVASTISAADAFLAANNSTSWAGLTKSQQQTVNGWMSALDNYNNGLTGPGHCDNT